MGFVGLTSFNRRNCSIEKASNEIKAPIPSMKKALAKSLRFKRRNILDFFWSFHKEMSSRENIHCANVQQVPFGTVPGF
jgi:hypothetical protein